MNDSLNALVDVLSRFRQETPIAQYGLPLGSLLPIEIELREFLVTVDTLSPSDLATLRGSIDLHLEALLNHYAQRQCRGSR